MDGMMFNRLAAIALLLTISRHTGAYSNPLEGRRAPCQEEGEPIAVDHIDKMNCYSCICKNGFVECQSGYHCPPTDGCHMLVEKTKDGCCRKCKGCSHNGVQHLSHTEWTDPANPCKVFRCEAGVVTESDLQCHTPCPNPAPPEPGKCCPTCSECKINGQIATDDRDVISDDPCLKCRCSGGRMTCSKKACPVLQCGPNRQHHPPGECCPRCSGTRSLYTVPKTCTVQNALFWEGQHFQIDKCTNCTCLSETSICRRNACPILDCAPDLQKSVPGSCCKQCIMPEEVRTQCSYGGQYYEDGQSWQLNACRSCKCHRGMPSCAMTRCNVTLPCAPGTHLVHLPGECCEKCVEVEGVCMVFGDPHYKTFDGKIYTFPGLGRYQLVSDCKQSSFSVRVANDWSNRSQKATTRRVSVRYGDLRLNLQQKSRVKLNRKRVKLPYKKEGKVAVDKIGDNIEVTLQNGVKIFWSGESFLEVSVPAAYKNKLCGLCGNFNGNVQDELKTKRGRVLKDNEILAFGASWCAGSKSICARFSKQSKQVASRPSCNGHRLEKNRCKYLSNDELFGECDSKLNYSKYYKTCKVDMCNCPYGKCYCDSLMAYARECERLGVQLPNWRKMSYCDERGVKRPKVGGKKPAFTANFTEEIIEKIRGHRNFNNRTRIPILIH